jgi:hypothetical protein
MSGYRVNLQERYDYPTILDELAAPAMEAEASSRAGCCAQ